MKSVNVEMHNDNDLKTEYVNAFAVYGNPVEFAFEFGYVDLPQAIKENNKRGKKGQEIAEVHATTKAKIVVPASQIQNLISAMQEQLNAVMNSQK